MSELAVAALLCGLLVGGHTEQGHEFLANGKDRKIRVDCETSTHVIEIGMDTAAEGTRDSVHQALFSTTFPETEGKIPAVILIDTDGFEERHEVEMREVAELAGVRYGRCHQHAIERWAATAGFRATPNELDDLPGEAIARSICDLEGVFAPEVTGVTGVSALLKPVDE